MKFSVFEPTPLECVEDLKDLIKDKVVYDLGAGNGAFAEEMKKHAKKVVAIEVDPMLAIDCQDRQLETIEDDFMNVNLKEAEVVYAFFSFIGNYNLYQKLKKENWKGVVISALYPLGNYASDVLAPNNVIHSKNLPFLIYEL